MHKFYTRKSIGSGIVNVNNVQAPKKSKKFIVYRISLIGNLGKVVKEMDEFSVA